MRHDRLPYLLIPLVAALAVLPLIANGCSCGHDFDFHLLSWMEAARQFAHGNLRPQWMSSAAWNAGEPRFVFYPPLSWTIGAALGVVLPWAATPIVYTWMALTAAGVAMYRLGRTVGGSAAALIVAMLYTVNPYMLFTAYERTAYAELLAAAWIPLLLDGILRRRVTIPGIAIPVAMLWLTNAPAAVMSCYCLALVTLFRSAIEWRRSRLADMEEPRSSLTSWIVLPRNSLAGTALGLGLAAFYIVPAAFERRYVQIAMAIIPGMRIEDNFLFHHTGDVPHDNVLHTASVIGVILIGLTIAVVAASPLLGSRLSDGEKKGAETRERLGLLVLLAIVLGFFLTSPALFLWKHLPELAFLQFPWRLVALVSAVLGATLALALSGLRLRTGQTVSLALVCVLPLIYFGYREFHQDCDPEDTVSARLATFRAGDGSEPTDEYTPVTADNDSLLRNSPPYWLASNADGKPPEGAPGGRTPSHLTIHTGAPQTLILNLRDYPAWKISVNGVAVAVREQRDDGLLAVPVGAGTSVVQVSYSQMKDHVAGEAISFFCLIPLLFSLRSECSRSRD